MLPDPLLFPQPDFYKADQALDISELVLKWSSAEVQEKLFSESLDVDCLVGFRIPDQTVKYIL